MTHRLSATTVWAMLCTAAAWAGTTVPLFENNVPLLSPPSLAPVVDATGFVNRSTLLINYAGELPFDGQNVRFWTNTGSGKMDGAPGFRFDYVKATNNNVQGRFPSAVFYNQGRIFGSNYLLVNASNIICPGQLSASGSGIIRLEGNMVDVSRAGVRTGQTNADNYSPVWIINTNFYQHTEGVSDRYWGAGTNNVMQGDGWPIRLGEAETNFSLPFPKSPLHMVNFANGLGVNYPIIVPNGASNYYPGITTNVVADYPYTAYVNEIVGSSNRTFQVVFVNTNNVNETDVRFYAPTPGAPAIVLARFKAVIADPVENLVLTNVLYFADESLWTTNPVLLNNYNAPTRKPDVFNIFRRDFGAWEEAKAANSTMFAVQFNDGGFVSNTAPVNYAAYGADLSFNSSIQGAGTPADPTNYAGRIEIIGRSANVDQVRIRAETTAIIRCTNMVNNRIGLVDAPFVVYDVGTTNSSLMVSNLAPKSVGRFSGFLNAWSGVWTSTLTNQIGTSEDIKFHVLILENGLKTNSPVVVQELSLTSPTNLVIAPSNYLSVRRSMTLNCQNLTIMSNASLASPPSGNWAKTNVLRLLNLTNEGALNITLAGYFGADRWTNIGTPTKVTNAVVPYNSLINRGQLQASALFINARHLVNAGDASYQTNIDSYLDTNTLFMVSVTNLFTNQPWMSTTGGILAAEAGSMLFSNSITETSGDLQLYCGDFTAQQSQFLAGNSNVFGTLILAVTNRLTDGGNNLWKTTAGMRLLRQPTNGDLMGTVIESTLARYSLADHVWAGQDRGVDFSGYSNNMALGRLVLDGSDASLFVFSAAGTSNALYVDYLDLRNFATNYNQALQVNPGMVLYFADASVPAVKLDGRQNGRIRWMRHFAGPGSSTNIQTRTGHYLTVNRALLDSSDIDSDADGIPNRYDVFPFDGVYLNSPLVVKTPGGTATLTWMGAADTVYTVEYRTNMSLGGWQVLRTMTNYTDGEMSLVEPATPGAPRFYRVRYQP